MSSRAPDPGSGDVRVVQRTLRDAADQQVSRIVAMVDGLAERAEADALIAPLRPRLAKLRPPRPMRLARLLFHPIESLLVSPARWKPGETAVPRSALSPIAQLVCERSPAVTAAVQAMIAGRTMDDLAAIAAAGALLWPEAARVLRDAMPPPDWNERGLPEAQLVPVVRGIAGALGEAQSLLRVVAEVREGLLPDAEAIDRLLDAAAETVEGWDFTIGALLGQVSDPAALLARIDDWTQRNLGRIKPSASERVFDGVLRRLASDATVNASVGQADLKSAAAEVLRLARLFECLDGPGIGAARRECLRGLRRSLDASCRARFESGMADALVAPLLEPLPSAGPVDARALEASTRSLRQMELTGRRLGNATFYDSMLGATASRLEAVPDRADWTLADKVRIIEILAGPERALNCLQANRVARKEAADPGHHPGSRPGGAPPARR